MSSKIESFKPTLEKGLSFYKSYTSHLTERISEVRGKISKPLFESLIKFDIQRTFLTIPPLDGELDFMTSFRTLAKDRSLDHKEKEARSKKLKNEFSRQIRGMANCRVILERLIQNNPDISKKTLDDCLKLFASKYGLPQERLEEYLESINSFATLRSNIKEAREYFPDDDRLFKELFPSYHSIIDKVKITTSPYEIIITTSKENIDMLQPGSGGFATTSIINIKNKFREKTLTIPVIFVPNNAGNANKFILTHEQEHSKNRFIMKYSKGFKFKESELMSFSVSALIRSFEYSKVTSEINYDKIPEQVEEARRSLELGYYEDPQTKEKVRIKGGHRAYLETFVREHSPDFQKEELKKYRDAIKMKILLHVHDSLGRARNEVIAMKADGESDYFTSLGTTDLYRYSFDEITDIFEKLNSSNIDIGLSLDQVKDNFTKDILRASQSFDDLMVKGKFSREEAVAILASVPLNSWSSVVRVLLNDLYNNK